MSLEHFKLLLSLFGGVGDGRVDQWSKSCGQLGRLDTE